MKELKVLFVGVGSIANRHIKNLRSICSLKNMGVRIDAYRRKYEVSDGLDEVFCQYQDVPDDYDVIFITNPTEYHLDSLRQFGSKGKHFFIEKPVVSLPRIQEARAFDLNEDSVYYVACPLRYTSVIQYMKHNINPREVISVRCISSSYLPDWRPGKDYRDTYSAHKNLGGGVSIDLIHEWDYLTYLFGYPEKVKAMIGKKSGLEIDSDDYAIYIGEYKDKIIELHLDYFGRKTLREIMVFTGEDTLVGDLVNNSLTFLSTGKTIQFDEERDDYQKKELECFLDMVLGNKEAEKGFVHGLDVLELTQGKVPGGHI